MKPIYSMLLLTLATLLLCSCVSRTVSTTPEYGQESGKVLEKKLVWIWQDEFSNP